MSFSKEVNAGPCSVRQGPGCRSDMARSAALGRDRGCPCCSWAAATVRAAGPVPLCPSVSSSPPCSCDAPGSCSKGRKAGTSSWSRWELAGFGGFFWSCLSPWDQPLCVQDTSTNAALLSLGGTELCPCCLTWSLGPWWGLPGPLPQHS